MLLSPEVVVRTMAITPLSPSQYRARRDGGVCQAKVFLMVLVLLGIKVEFGAAAAAAALVRSPPLTALAPSDIPPPPPQTALQQSQQVTEALRSNNFTTAAQLIQTYLPILRLNSTVFVPTNEALASISAATPVLTLLSYHVAGVQYNFSQLVRLPIGTRLATSLGNDSVVITNNDRSDYQIDNVRIVFADACASAATNLGISCHGVEAVFNETLFGHTISDPLAPSPVPAPVPEPLAAPYFGPAVSPPVPSILPRPPAVPTASPVGVIPVAHSPSKLDPTGRASACRVRPPFRHLFYFIFLGVMSMRLGL